MLTECYCLALENDHGQGDFDLFSSDSYFPFSSPELQNDCQVPEFLHVKITISQEWQFSILLNLRPLLFSHLLMQISLTHCLVRNLEIMLCT